jgi:hypothetical protein
MQGSLAREIRQSLALLASLGLACAGPLALALLAVRLLG